jgi:hypothetical protein
VTYVKPCLDVLSRYVVISDLVVVELLYFQNTFLFHIQMGNISFTVSSNIYLLTSFELLTAKWMKNPLTVRDILIIFLIVFIVVPCNF